jgi:glycosyltransferase involved in cell wall biosynthesis
MVPQPPSVHCELAPILINRTAVYQICRALPRELRRRSLRVSCSALLSRLDPETVTPVSPWQEHRYRLSRRWLLSALSRPGLFLRTRWAAACFLPRAQKLSSHLILDPLYLLFHRDIKRGAVVVYDVTPVTDPAWHHPGVGALYRAAFASLAHSSCRVIAVSRNTADHLRVNWGIAPSRLAVLPLGLLPSESMPAPRAEPVREPYLLFVGSLEPRKNVAGLLRAYQASGLYQSRSIRLRLVGAIPNEADPTVALARATPGVDLLGFVGESDLVAAYQGCLAFVYPSFCEGFGLPLLEAMQHGCVCLASRAGASPEIGGDLCPYVDPYSVGDMAQGLCWIADLAESERHRRGRLLRERAEQFTWSRFCDRLADLLKEQN